MSGVQQEDIALINIYAPNIGAPKKKILEDFKKEIDSNAVIVGHFNSLLSTIDRSSKQKANKNIAELNNTLNQMDLIDIYRTFHPKEAKYIFFLNTHGSFPKIDHMVGHKTSLNKFKKMKSYQAFFWITMA
ncbi:hypothetical protein HJG60_009746 [Phyllostomus discolor]|uniref:Uncharacterized protein n=1 Tax=Phyllostomus discolor TaxID=89673 RepID=A0A834BCH0_9CHIR|nr:hypothetical protein HJG60_009746 [Phyllostomus discolor]